MNKSPLIKLNDGTEIPQVGFGTWQLVGEKEVSTSLKAAYDCGYRHIDTAQVYNNEYAIGDFLIKHDVKDTYITTKVWVSNFANESDFKKSVKESLVRLGVTKVNLILLHWGMSKEVSIQAYKWLEEVKAEGLTDSIGVSNFNAERIKDILEVSKIKPAINQVQFDLVNQQKDLIALCTENDIKVEGYSLLKPYLGSSSRLNLTDDEKSIVDGIAKNHNKTGSQIILRYAIEKGIIIFPKSRNADRVKQNFDIFDFNLTNDEIKTLEGLDHNPHQRMDDTASGEWDYMLETPLLFERNFKTQETSPRYINDESKKINR